MTTTTTVTITVDDENNGEQFWPALRERFPAIARELTDAGSATIAASDWTAIQQLPGFADGPAHARTALAEVQ